MDEINTEAPTVMLGGYVNNGDIEKSLSLFKVLPIKDVTSWTTIIHGLMQNGQERTALELLFEKKLGQIFDEVHAYTEKVGHNLDVPLRSLIIDMYFLTACSHSGLLEEGRGYFELVREVYGIKPGIEHFACMVGLYGRRGRLDEIKQFIYQNGISNVTSVWTTILSSFRLHRNVELGKWTWEELLRLFPNDSTPYVLLSNICADEGRWTEAANISSQIRKRRLKKVPGQSWI
ncbi:hypothetical protein CRG98_029445 [Punica granatum]|uniref:Uncharacterized protein n=1 Tax=Punica granatum TaxID=22663 RepID=A0A2I0J1M2_PUNGR|nr:hypothetical protein CRG98_029445 [Punica granatum]